MNGSSEALRTIAVTGAAGLLGRNLCNYFSDKGWRVHALVRDTSNHPFQRGGINVYKCVLPDVIDIKSIEKANVLIHSAYMTRFTDLEEAKRVNEEGTSRLYKIVRSAGVGKFVFISSRTARANAPAYYGVSKYRMESILDPSRDLAIRPGLILASDGGLFNRMVNQVRRLPVVPLFGGGQQILNTIHVEDLCKIIEWAVENNICGVITAAESEGITMKELILSVLEELGQKKPVLSVPGRPMLMLLQMLESIKIKLPVSSENLRGLLNREDMGEACSDSVKKSGINIRDARESIKSLIPKLK